MFSEPGDFSFDENLNRHVYYEGLEDRLYDHPLHLWLMEISLRHETSALPHYIEEVRTSHRALDHKVWECHGHHTVVFGLNETEKGQEEHHGDALRDDEIKLELRFFEMAWEVHFTLTSDLRQSFNIVAELARFVKDRYHIDATECQDTEFQVRSILAKAGSSIAA